MEHNTKSDKTKREGPKDLQEANENIRKAEGDEPASPADRATPMDNKAGNKPAIDRGR